MEIKSSCRHTRLLAKTSILALSFPFLILGSGPALAQFADRVPAGSRGADQPSQEADQHADKSASAAISVDEVIVTAQRREQRASDVGLTINVLSSTELKATGVTDPASLVRVTPGLDVGETQSGFPQYSIRGVNFNSIVVSGAPAVTAYLDGAPLPYSIMWSGLLLDVDHVEVLKGPQGTLFGQNATGAPLT